MATNYTTKKHQARSGAKAGQWVNCEAAHCRLGGTHIREDQFQATKLWLADQGIKKTSPQITATDVNNFLNSPDPLTWVDTYHRQHDADLARYATNNGHTPLTPKATYTGNYKINLHLPAKIEAFNKAITRFKDRNPTARLTYQVDNTGTTYTYGYPNGLYIGPTLLTGDFKEATISHLRIEGTPNPKELKRLEKTFTKTFGPTISGWFTPTNTQQPGTYTEKAADGTETVQSRINRAAATNLIKQVPAKAAEAMLQQWHTKEPETPLIEAIQDIRRDATTQPNPTYFFKTVNAKGKVAWTKVSNPHAYDPDF